MRAKGSNANSIYILFVEIISMIAAFCGLYWSVSALVRKRPATTPNDIEAGTSLLEQDETPQFTEHQGYETV